ncbi:MAG: hypothetical protein ABIL20_06485, partial [candidate division WOR-3 bacterium]
LAYNTKIPDRPEKCLEMDKAKINRSQPYFPACQENVVLPCLNFSLTAFNYLEFPCTALPKKYIKYFCP